MRSRTRPAATAFAAVLMFLIGGSLAGCSMPSNEVPGNSDEPSTIAPQAGSETETPKTTEPPEQPPTLISLTELKTADRTMQAEACTALLGSPQQIAEKLGLPVDYLDATEADRSDTASAPWTEAATTSNVRGQIDLSCNFQTEYQGTVYVVFGVPGDDGINAYCENAELLCVATEDRQRMITLINHGAEPVDGTVNDAPLKELLDRFTA